TVAFVTGHEDPTKSESRIDWKGISTIGTLVFLMGVRNLPRITDALMRAGRDPATPVALIRWGTTPDQETLTGTLGDIAARAEEHGFAPPAICVVGEVVGLRDHLAWFEKRPLFGKGIVITRPERQAEEFAALLREKGARVISFPTIEIAPPEDFGDLDRAIEHIEQYHWIIFTSANGVRSFFDRFATIRGDIRDLKGIRVCTIGPATRACVEGYHIPVDLVPDEYLSEGVVAAFGGLDMKDKKVLLPRAEIAGDVIPAGLSAMGSRVDVAVAYRTVSPGGDGSEVREMMANGTVDVLTFTSPSTVHNFIDIAGGREAIPDRVKIACIGPVTERACEEAGIRVDIMQGPYSIPGLVEAIERELRQAQETEK
ncbi:MAG: uroporphyrinogen-III synthase, partial [Deltaproteobacteria bacterium]|nr:uroporphyrinogen-III synthase [Deltaproteobacteria bacterium]